MKVKSRKQMRKEFRKAKKLKKHEFFSKKKPKSQRGDQWGKKKMLDKEKDTESFSEVKGIEKRFQKVDESVKKEKNRKKFKNPQEKQDFEIEKDRQQKEKLEREFREQRLRQLKADNLREDVEIRKLEKQLKMNKGKKSKAFACDGLDYLLDICDKRESKNMFERVLKDSDSEFESDLENIVGEDKKKVTFKKQKKLSNEKEKKEQTRSDDSDTGEEFSSSESEEAECWGTEDDEVSTSELSNVDFEVKEQSTKKPKGQSNKNEKKKPIKHCEGVNENAYIDKDSSEIDCDLNEGISSENIPNENESQGTRTTWEDIYGRTRDEKGNVMTTYTPPHLRKVPKEGNASEKLTKLRKHLKGLLNRLAESNMSFISNQVEQLYMSNSRNDMNETLCALFWDSLVTEVLTPERLVTEHAMLIAVLHANVGSEIGAHFLQHFVLEFCKMLKSKTEVEDKRINNTLCFILQLYNFQIFHSKLMYDLVNELLKDLEEKQVELLLTTFRTVGFSLRKDDPLALKSLILKVQEQINSVSASESSSRVKFMLEMLMAIKNNNMSKIPNYNPEFVEKLKKNLKVLVRKGNYSVELNISLQDLLNAEKHGRWWIVGSAWSGAVPSQEDAQKSKLEDTPSTEFGQKLLKLARKQRMNTDVRRNIFCILMSAEDFLEAFEKLLKLKLKGAAEREIANVLLHCALQEKNFNPYYVFLANKFCTFDRKYQMMLQCAIWDRIKELGSALPVQVTNLAKFVGNLILERGLPISILKVIQFSELDKPTIKFMRQLLLAILVNEDRNAVAAVFKRIADSPKLKLFRESLRLFLRHFVNKNTGRSSEREGVSRMVEMIEIAEQALTSSDNSMIF